MEEEIDLFDFNNVLVEKLAELRFFWGGVGYLNDFKPFTFSKTFICFRY